jgi:hypothetical protein
MQTPPREIVPQNIPSPSDWEQRYLILECKVWIFEDAVHEDNEFAHDGGEGDQRTSFHATN